RTWVRSTSKYRTPPADAAVSSESRSLRNGGWLVTRRLLPVPGNDTISFWTRSHNSAKRESVEVWISTSGPSPPEFTIRLAALGIASSSYRRVVLSLGDFDSIPVYIAFRCVSLGKRITYIDDIAGPSYIPADVGPTTIIHPRAYERPDTVIYPRVVIKNYGSPPI
ncbi:MAG: choice-of-anchor J domain-containing protein, partial [candidate division WOR-3 bacterium]